MKLYPVFLNIDDMLAVVVGGGDVASRKMKDLAGSGARIKIIAPELKSDILEFADKNRNVVEIIQREYKNGDIDGANLVFSCTDNAELNRKIYMEAQEKSIPVNAVDDPENCTFFVPSHTRNGDLLLAVSTSGASPAMAARLRRIFEKHIPENISEILDSLRNARVLLQNKNDLPSRERGDILKKIVNDDSLLLELIKNFKNGTIKEFLDSL